MEYIGSIFFDKKLIDAGEIVIFGTGHFGMKIHQYIKNNNIIDKVRCFCDNNSSKWGQNIEGIPVVSVDEAVKKYSDAHYLVMGRYDKEMIDCLVCRAVTNIHLLINC